jgi:hypothetical protein
MRAEQPRERHPHLPTPPDRVSDTAVDSTARKRAVTKGDHQVPAARVTAATRTPSPTNPDPAAPAAHPGRSTPVEVPHHQALPLAVRSPHPAGAGALGPPVSHRARHHDARTDGHHVRPVPGPATGRHRGFSARPPPRPRHHENQPSEIRPSENGPRPRRRDRSPQPQPSERVPTPRRARRAPAPTAASAPANQRRRFCACTHRFCAVTERPTPDLL